MLAACNNAQRSSREESAEKKDASAADGSRGAYGRRIYRVGDDDYGSGVHGKLVDANYDVEVLTRGQ